MYSEYRNFVNETIKQNFKTIELVNSKRKKHFGKKGYFSEKKSFITSLDVFQNGNI